MRFLGKKSGFSLIELAIVIVIIGLLAAGGISIMSSNLDTAKYISTKDKMTEVMNALRRYYAANAKLPCPAKPNAIASSSDYGLSYTSSGSCNGALPADFATYGIVRTEVVASSGNWVRQGALPTRTLGLPDNMMYDDYGSKLTYIVTEAFTTSAVNGRITIKDGNGNNVVTDAAVAVISHGKDRKGGYTEGGTQISCDNTHPLDYKNCDQGIEVNTSVLTDAQFNDNSGNASKWFDDIIKWENRDTVIGLVPSSTGLFSVRFTTTTDNGNIGGTAAADTLCTNEVGAGYAFCKKSDLETYGSLGQLANVSSYIGATGWIHDTSGGANTCSTWSTSSGNGQTLSNTTGKWEISSSVACSGTYKIACCKRNDIPSP